MFANREIFTVPLFAEIQERTAKAIHQVAALPPGVMRNPAMAGEVEKIIEQFGVEIPELRPEQKSGKRRVERSNGYERTLIDVTIPTTGDAQALRLQPSNSPIFQIPISLTRNGIVVTLADNDGLEREIDDFVARVQPAIALLKHEATLYLPSLRQAVERAAQERLVALRDQDERDKKRKFPIA